MLLTSEYKLLLALTLLLLAILAGYLYEHGVLLAKGPKIDFKLVDVKVVRYSYGLELTASFVSASNKPIYITYIMLQDPNTNRTIVLGDGQNEVVNLPILLKPGEEFLFSGVESLNITDGFDPGSDILIRFYYSLTPPTGSFDPNDPRWVPYSTRVTQSTLYGIDVPSEEGMLRLTVTVTNNDAVARYVDWVPAVISGDAYSIFWSTVKNDGSDIYVTDAAGRPLNYAVYIDKNNQFAVVWFKLSATIPAGNSMIAYIYYGGNNPYSSYRTTVNWAWWQIRDLAQWPTNPYTLQTTIYYQSITNTYIYVKTYPWYRKITKTIYAPYQNIAIAKGLLIDLYELRLSTTYILILKDIAGTEYRLVVSSCYFRWAEVRLYEVTDSGLVLLKAVETGCKSSGSHQIVSIKTSDAPNPPQGGVILQIPSDLPLSYVEFWPRSGDSGTSYAYFYFYAPSNLPIYLNNIDVTVTPG